MAKMSRQKDQELIKSNKMILQANSKLTTEIIEVKEENQRLNKQL